MKLINLIILFTLLKVLMCEFFSSTAELRNLEGIESELIELLKNFAAKLENKNIYVKKILKNLEDEHTLMRIDVDEYLFNPLNSFSLIKRLSHDIDELQNNFQFVDEFLKKINKIKLPTSELDGATEGLYRLQYTYDLKTEDFVNGIIDGKKYGRKLSVLDLQVIAKIMMNFDKKYAMKHIEIAKKSSFKLKKNLRVKFLKNLLKIYNSISDHKLALEVLDEIKEIDPNYQKYDIQKRNIELLSSNVKREVIQKSNNSDLQLSGSYWTEAKEKLIFAKACQQKLEKSVKEMSQLHCRYISKTFFTKIAPFKIIEANLDPYIVIYVDVISDKEIELLQTIAQKDLQRASIMNDNSTTEVSKERVAQLSWPEDSRHKIFQILTNRVNDMTGLNMATAEEWQIQNYGIGGFYSAHHDFTIEGQTFDDNNGNRIATMLFYLSDVEKGGGTVFPLLRVYVPPVKGTAVFWYNLSSSGNREYMTRHAACPVLIGNKWVANKWIRENGQQFTRPCELVPKPTQKDYYLKTYDLKDYEIKI